MWSFASTSHIYLHGLANSSCHAFAPSIARTAKLLCCFMNQWKYVMSALLKTAGSNNYLLSIFQEIIYFLFHFTEGSVSSNSSFEKSLSEIHNLQMRCTYISKSLASQLLYLLMAHFYQTHFLQVLSTPFLLLWSLFVLLFTCRTVSIF